MNHSFLENLRLYTFAALLCCGPLYAQEASRGAEEPLIDLPPEVVTAPRSERGLEVILDAKAPMQPIPAQDGADFLKSVPGFSVIRKGGTDGDPVLRGMAGSRLIISADGQPLLGGCPMRMDPPTAYIFPAAYDRVRVLKGPQTVLYGPGNSAGVVVFETESTQLPGDTATLHGSLVGGSFGRFDVAADATVGTPEFFVRANATRNESDHYEDGSGNEVHSAHMR